MIIKIFVVCIISLLSSTVHGVEQSQSATVDQHTQTTQKVVVGTVIVGLTIDGTSGVGQNNVPITFGQVLKPGQIPANTSPGTDYKASIVDLLKNTATQTWLSGSEVTEWIVTAPFKTAGGTEHPHLTARFNVRAYAGFDSVRVDVIVKNNWSYVPDPQNFDYDISVSLCGNNVYNKTDLTHYHHARWRKTFWCGNEPAVHIKHDIDLLNPIILAIQILPLFQGNLNSANKTTITMRK